MATKTQPRHPSTGKFQPKPKSGKAPAKAKQLPPFLKKKMGK